MHLKYTPARVTLIVAAAVALVGTVGGLALVLSGPAIPPGIDASDPLTPTPGLPWFEDVAATARIDFRHFDPATPAHYIQETMGSGV